MIWSCEGAFSRSYQISQVSQFGLVTYGSNWAHCTSSTTSLALRNADRYQDHLLRMTKTRDIFLHDGVGDTGVLEDVLPQICIHIEDIVCSFRFSGILLDA